MAEQPGELRQVNWEECFSFTRIFQTFRMAIHPSKLGLALAAIVLTVLFGKLLDLIWSGSDCRPLGGEIHAFWQVPNIDRWRDDHRVEQAARLAAVYAAIGAEAPKDLGSDFEKDPEDAVKDARDELGKQREAGIKEVEDAKKDDAEKDEALARVNRLFNEYSDELGRLGPKGVFGSYTAFQMSVLRQLIESARGLNFTGGINEVMSGRATREMEDEMLGPGAAGLGVLSCLALAARADQWLLTEHWFFALLFGLGTLAIWSLFGGAICRIAALNMARDERISIKSALGFAQRKFLGFFTAPLLPIGMVAAVGVFLFLGGLFGAVPYVGDLFLGLGFVLALLGGFVMALVVIGALAGGGLLWPTIAVEGSDSFDAVSRAYSYVYSKPWRAGFYAAVATVYGALTYLFVRFFTLILLKATRLFICLGITFFGVIDYDRPGTGEAGASKMDAVWPHPTFEDLNPSPEAFAMTGGDAVAGFLIRLWLYVVVGLLYAYLASFFFSGATTIYYLLRRKVDATDLDEVFIEDEEEDDLTPAVPAPPEATPPAAAAPAPEPSPAPPPSPVPPAEYNPPPESPPPPSGDAGERQEGG